MLGTTPLISVIIPTLNEQHSLPKCLKSIVNQQYPRSKIEILVIDDGSTDKTIQIAKRFGAKVICNGSHHIERGKSIGLENATGTYIFFIDADNVLTSRKWFRDAIDIFHKHKEVVGIEGWRYSYKKNDSLVNRYCALFGINDPLTYYLDKAGFIMSTENQWKNHNSLVANYDGYFLIKFSTDNMTVIGSNGYMTKKALLIKTQWKPYLFHLDSAYDLVKIGHNTFARIKYDVEHDFASSFWEMLNKIKRNADLFLKYKDVRRYKYKTSLFKKFWTVLVMVTFIVPFVDAFKGYLRKRDYAWFLHPQLCFFVICVDAISICQYYLSRIIFVKSKH